MPNTNETAKNEITDIVKEENPEALPFSKVSKRSNLQIDKYWIRNMNVGAMNNYAYQYAYGHNNRFINYGSNDCTNFASQLLWKGGMGQNSYWYSTSSRDQPYQGSAPWINANLFANYFNIGFKSKNHWWSFTAQLKAGNFIGFDNATDGSVDHVGYVTEVRTYRYSHFDGSANYQKSVKIAQHSSNYIGWDTNEAINWQKRTYQAEFVRIGI